MWWNLLLNNPTSKVYSFLLIIVCQLACLKSSNYLAGLVVKEHYLFFEFMGSIFI